MKNTEKKVVMISGANRGIGKVVAEKLSEEGYLLSLGIRNPSSLFGPLSSRPETQLLCHVYDAKIPESAKFWIGGPIENFGRIDVLITMQAFCTVLDLKMIRKNCWMKCGK